MVNHPERINQIECFWTHDLVQLFGTAMKETDAVSQAIDLGALARDLERLLLNVHGCHRSAIAREVHRVRANAAANFEDTLASPALEFRKAEDMRLNEILARFDFIEVFPCADGLR